MGGRFRFDTAEGRSQTPIVDPIGLHPNTDQRRFRGVLDAVGCQGASGRYSYRTQHVIVQVEEADASCCNSSDRGIAE
jgi:hypothetical protein